MTFQGQTHKLSLQTIRVIFAVIYKVQVQLVPKTGLESKSWTRVLHIWHGWTSPLKHKLATWGMWGD